MDLEEIEAYWRIEFEERILPYYLSHLDLCHYCGITVYNLSEHEQMTGEKKSHKVEKTIDHIIPTSKGGCNGKHNKVIACRSCNSKKGNKLNYVHT